MAFAGDWETAADPAHFSTIVSNAAALIHFAKNGHGLAYVSDFIIRDQLDRGELVSVLDEHLNDGGRFIIVWAAPRVPPKLRVFIDYVANHLMRRDAQVVIPKLVGALSDG